MSKKLSASPSCKVSRSVSVRTAIPQSPHFFDNDDTSGGDGAVSQPPSVPRSVSKSIARAKSKNVSMPERSVSVTDSSQSSNYWLEFLLNKLLKLEGLTEWIDRVVASLSHYQTIVRSFVLIIFSIYLYRYIFAE